MSVVVMWRCADCATIDECVAPEPSRVVAAYVPEGWTLLSDVRWGPDDPHYILRCPECSSSDDDDEETDADDGEEADADDLVDCEAKG